MTTVKEIKQRMRELSIPGISKVNSGNKSHYMDLIAKHRAGMRKRETIIAYNSMKKLAKRLERRQFPTGVDGDIIRLNYYEMQETKGYVPSGVINPSRWGGIPSLLISISVKYYGYARSPQELSRRIGEKAAANFEKMKKRHEPYFDSIKTMLRRTSYDMKAYYNMKKETLTAAEMDRINGLIQDFFRSWYDAAKVY